MKRLCYPWAEWKGSFHNYLSITWHLERFYWHFRLLGNHLRGLLKQLHCIYQNWWYVRANFPDKCDIAQVFKKWNVHQLAYYDVHQITTPDGSCSKLHFHEWCIIIIFWWYTYWNNAYKSQLQFFQFFELHYGSLHSCLSLHVGRIMPISKFFPRIFEYSHSWKCNFEHDPSGVVICCTT